MHVVTKYPDGVFCWVDLASTDVDAAKAFYADLFGWRYLDMPTEYGEYSMCQIDGKSVAALSAMPPGMDGIPSFWSSYINSENLDTAAEKVAAAGGTITMPTIDVDQGRMFTAIDPEGVHFGVWEARSHIGAQLVNMPNTLVWNELATRDAKSAARFYGDAFDWTVEYDENGYGMFAVDSRRQAGMMQMDESWGDMPANWGVYFMVADIDAAATKVQELGGSVMMGPFDAGEVGKIAVCADPTGAVFSAIEMNFVDPPPGA